MASFVFFKGIATLVCALRCWLLTVDKAQQAYGRKILCTHLILAVDYHGWCSCLFITLITEV
jgi:hypothetical protein